VPRRANSRRLRRFGPFCDGGGVDKLVGLDACGRGTPRHGFEVVDDAVSTGLGFELFRDTGVRVSTELAFEFVGDTAARVLTGLAFEFGDTAVGVSPGLAFELVGWPVPKVGGGAPLTPLS
jgi:hypothetical protein